MDKHENRHKIPENRYPDLKFGTGKVFETRNTILTSVFRNSKAEVSYNAMSSGDKTPQIMKEWHKISENGD